MKITSLVRNQLLSVHYLKFTPYFNKVTLKVQTKLFTFLLCQVLCLCKNTSLIQLFALAMTVHCKDALLNVVHIIVTSHASHATGVGKTFICFIGKCRLTCSKRVSDVCWFPDSFFSARRSCYDTAFSENKHQCPNCSRSYKHKTSLMFHLRKECGKEPDMKCPHCTTYRAKHIANLRSHIKHCHGSLHNPF